jgi:hypothetical protein
LVELPSGEDAERAERLGKGMAIAGGAFFLGFVVGLSIATVHDNRAVEEQLKAFDTFDADLRLLLNLCRDERYRVTACVAAPATAPSSSPVVH